MADETTIKLNDEELNDATFPISDYGDDSIVTMEGMKHIRLRPGMYIGRLGDGSQSDDGIYVLLKEIIDNSIDEYRSGYGKRIDVELTEEKGVRVRDYGRGIPLGKLVEAVSIPNTGGKFDSKVFHKSIGMNGVGTKAANALSACFVVRSIRDGVMRRVEFHCGELAEDTTAETDEPNGTEVYFVPDNTLFKNYNFEADFIDEKLRNYTYLNANLSIYFNGRHIVSRNGLEDLLNDAMSESPLYPIVHLKDTDIEIAFTHTNRPGEVYYSFVNGQHTTLGGTHQSALKEHIAATIKDFYGKPFDVNDTRNGLVAAIAINVVEPMFESQTKVKLGSLTMEPDGTLTVKKFIGDFVKKNLDNFLHKTPEVAELLLQKILSSERERKELQGMSKQVKERAKKISLHNDKLRDCHIHYNDARGNRQNESSIFITEGNSASGSITKVRDVATQAVFSLRGKSLNVVTHKADVYKNEELSLLQAALNIENGIEGLRYNKVIIATDADDDGMHIRLLILSFFLQFYPEMVKQGHVYILDTPLFRVRSRNKKRSTKEAGAKVDAKAAGAAILKDKTGSKRSEFETRYCYTEQERVDAIRALGPSPEITRFKGLGEISPPEFKHFIGPEMRLQPVSLHKDDRVKELLNYYMGKNTLERQSFIIENLVVEEDRPEEDFIEG